MPFEFVDNNATIDRASRRRIRSHVAKGKNVGRKLVRPSRIKAFGRKAESAPTLDHVPGFEEEEEEEEAAHSSKLDHYVVGQIERQVGNGLFVRFSLKQTPESRGLVLRTYSFMSGPRLDPQLRNAISSNVSSDPMWVQLMFVDEAYFHSAVAVSISALNKLVSKQEDPNEAMRHISQALRLVNENLSGKDALSNANIAVVVIMAQYERLQNHYRQGLVHLDGLQRMVELRGGIFQLKRDNPTLAQKIYRADLENSLHHGSPTRFSIGNIYRPATVEFLNSFETRSDRTVLTVLNFPIFKQLSTNLQRVLTDITHLAWVLQDAHTGQIPKVCGHAFHETLLMLGYDLIHISPLGEARPISHLDNLVHLGLAAFMMTLFRGLDGRIPGILLLSELVRSAIREQSDSKREYQELLLWLLFLRAASIFGEADEAWSIAETAMTMQTLGLHTWEDVAQTISKFPWVSAVHDKAGEWHHAVSCSTLLLEATPESSCIEIEN